MTNTRGFGYEIEIRRREGSGAVVSVGFVWSFSRERRVIRQYGFMTSKVDFWRG